MDYLCWNNALASHFFKPEQAHMPVHLYVTQELVDQLGRDNGASEQDFIDVMRRGPEWITDGRLSLCAKAYRVFETWKTAPETCENPYPPYIGYLCLFSLAAGIDVEGDFASHAYYPRLHRLLGEDETSGAPAGFDRMWELWLGLDEWSKSERNGDWGVFDFRILGGWDHVGLPVGQTLLSEEERGSLPRLFCERALDPDSAPSDAEMLFLLRGWGSSYLQRRTRRLLDGGSDSSGVSAVVHAVVAELEHWDGTNPEPDSSGAGRSISSSLRLCCRYDAAAAAAQFRLRCKAATEYPETGLVLASVDPVLCLRCDDESLGWSTELSVADTGAVFDASSLDWRSGLELANREESWRAVYCPSTVRLLVVGAEFGLPGYIETGRLSPGTEFLIAACEKTEQIAKWGTETCDSFEELEIQAGLPEDWRLFRGRNPNSDTAIREVIPRLALCTDIRLSMRGGVRTQDGNTSRYFSFAPPQIIVECSGTSPVVNCNGRSLQPDAGTTEKYSLPRDLPVDSPIRIEVMSERRCEARASLRLAEPVYSRWQEVSVGFDEYGRRLPGDASGLRGAKVQAPATPAFNFGTAIPGISASRVFLIGQVPGQVHIWPNSEVPDWQAVWAIGSERRGGFVIPCMADPDNAEPVAGQYGVRRDARVWKKLVWHMRKRLTPPTGRRFRQLWDRYKEVARHV